MDTDEQTFAELANQLEETMSTPDVSLVTAEAERRAITQRLIYRSALVITVVALAAWVWTTVRTTTETATDRQGDVTPADVAEPAELAEEAATPGGIDEPKPIDFDPLELASEAEECLQERLGSAEVRQRFEEGAPLSLVVAIAVACETSAGRTDIPDVVVSSYENAPELEFVADCLAGAQGWERVADSNAGVAGAIRPEGLSDSETQSALEQCQFYDPESVPTGLVEVPTTIAPPSNGTATVTVPPTGGLDLGPALDGLDANGLLAGELLGSADASCLVVGTDPPEGAAVPIGSAVSIILSECENR